MPSITDSMIKKIACGSGLLEASAALLCADFAKKSLNDIIKKGGDVYYAPFAAAVIKAFDSDFDFSSLKEYLRSCSFNALDLPNLAAFARAASFAGFVCNTLNDKISGTPASTPYECFLKLGAVQDLNIEYCVCLSTLEAFRAPSGGFSNFENPQFASPNATAAAVCAKFFRNGLVDKNAIKYLLSVQGAEGGFKAQEDSFQPDLLTTSSALFALSSAGQKSRCDAQDFIASHWLDDGSFSATVYDNKGDCEYLFYGLLALGSAS